jgi:hypothetical protein
MDELLVLSVQIQIQKTFRFRDKDIMYPLFLYSDILDLTQ